MKKNLVKAMPRKMPIVTMYFVVFFLNNFSVSMDHLRVELIMENPGGKAGAGALSSNQNR